LLLGLNCGFKQAEALGICIDEINLAEKLLGRVRFKTNVPGQWRLWDVTCLALDWAMKRRPDQSLPVLIQTTHGKRIGTALGKRTKSGNRGGRIANFWRALYKRIRKDEKSFPFLPYSTLRDTGASAIRSIAGGEIAEMYLSHGNPIPDGALLESYANKPWAKLHDALTVWGDRLAEAFKVDDPFPAEYRRAANIALSKKTIEKIAELRNQGYKLKTIADKVGCSFYAVRTYQNA
jgi:hypothetical protein